VVLAAEHVFEVEAKLEDLTFTVDLMLAGQPVPVNIEPDSALALPNGRLR
jgi:hypothetical protein